MISKLWTGIVVILLFSETLFIQCEEKKTMNEKSFEEDVAFLKQYTQLVTLSDADGQAKVAVCPELQGRIMTSTTTGDDGMSFGWINYNFFEEGIQNEHMNAYGGEDRMWLGPEGGQFSIFFKPGVSMTFENWFTPAPINSESWALEKKIETSLEMHKKMHLTNYSGINFDLKINRTVLLLAKTFVDQMVGIDIGNAIDFVGYETKNTLTNIDDKIWDKETGTISIWMLDMLKTGPNVTVIIPYKEGDEQDLGPIATTNYFGEIPSDRIIMKDGLIYFKADGKKRGKLGISWKRTKRFAGSYDADKKILTLITFSVPEQEKLYVNSLWEYQKNPFEGDVLNSYNDGPLEDGSQMGPFYEIESSSPAAFLKPGESITHYHRVFHFIGDEEELDRISKKALSVTTGQITAAF